MKHPIERILPAAAGVNLIVSALAVSRLPGRVPIHFNYAFQVDRMGSYAWLMILPAIALAVSIGMLFERRRSEANAKALTLSMTAICCLFIALGWTFYAACSTGAQLGDAVRVPIDLVICLGMSALMILLGNYMPTLRDRNRTFGIRTRATLSDEACWRKVHRFGGMAFVTAGLWMMIATLLGYFMNQKWLELAGLLAGFLGACLACLLYARKCGKEIV